MKSTIFAATPCTATMTGAGVPWKGALALLVAFLIGIALAKPSGSQSVGDTA